MAKLSLEDISDVTFHKAGIGGYKPEEVEKFIDEVEETVRALIEEKNDLTRKLSILAKKNEEYKIEEESIRSTLFSAQKLAAASVREAKHKSEMIIRNAKNQAGKIVHNAEESILSQQDKLHIMQKEVADFRAKLLGIYKEHLKLIDALPKEVDTEYTDTEIKTNTEQSTENNLYTNMVIDESMPIEDVKKAVQQAPDFENFANTEISNNQEQFNENLDLSGQSSEYEEDDGFDFLKESKTIKFDAIKFGDNYNISNDNDGN